MRRADLSPAVSDAEPAGLPAYADSDVGSSPRSVGVAVPVGRASGSLPDEPPSTLKWDDTAFSKVKLMCSFGGRILPRPHDNQLRYVGGESRIAVVTRNITFSELTAKLSCMFGSSVIIKYQLPYEDLDALISVTSDEDLENMMEEYDRLQIACVGVRPSASARLRLFLFPSKFERSQTASLPEMTGNNHSREGWFVDILNGLPVLSGVRSETSSIVSETPDYSFQGNMDALEEWAAAASYGNTNAPPSTVSLEQIAETKQENSAVPMIVFGSLLQPANEASSAPGSPSPVKPKPTTFGSSSSAPPAVISELSAIAGAASKGLPTHFADVEGSYGSLSGKSRLGSGDSIGSVPEHRKNVNSEILLLSEKSIVSSVGGAEQLLPSGLMDDDNSSQKYVAKESFDEVIDNFEAAALHADGHHVVSDPSSRAFRGDMLAESRAQMGQPIFDDDLSPIQMLARNLNALQIDEIAPFTSTCSASSHLLPPGLAPQKPVFAGVMPKIGADEQMRQHALSISPRGLGDYSSSEDQTTQQVLSESPSNAVLGLRGDLDEGATRQVSPSLADFLPSLVVPQQPPKVAGEDNLMPQILGANVSKDVETFCKVQATSCATSAVLPSLPLPTVQQDKLNAMNFKVVPISSHFYQQLPAEAPNTAVMLATQVPGTQLPSTMQILSPVAVAISHPLPPNTVPLRPVNTAVPSRPSATGISCPQSPPAVVSQHTPPLAPQVRASSPPSMVPSSLASNVSQPESVKGHAPRASNVGPVSAGAIISTGEGIRTIPVQQNDTVNYQRLVGDPAHNQRLGAMNPQVANQFNAPSLSVPPAPGVPTRFRAMGHPMQQVAEGFPLQQAPLADKKVPIPMQRAGTSPSVRAPSASGAQYSYFAVEQPNLTPQLAALGGTPRYNAPSDIPLGAPPATVDSVSSTGANPFIDSFQAANAYQDVLEVPPADQSQRRLMR